MVLPMNASAFLRGVLAMALFAGAGCGGETPVAREAPTVEPAAPAVEPAARSPLESALRDPARFACGADEDCTNSCELGAVNARWYETLEPIGFVECEDGCADVDAAPPRCEDRRCVAYREPAREEEPRVRRDECTERQRRR
jgi:hypothetical protein